MVRLKGFPITAYMVQKYSDGFFGGKWVNVKGFSDKKKAIQLKEMLE